MRFNFVVIKLDLWIRFVLLSRTVIWLLLFNMVFLQFGDKEFSVNANAGLANPNESLMLFLSLSL